MSRRYHPEYREMQKLLNTNGVDEVYHFTSIDNLPSIINEEGLLSINKLREKGLENSINYGGNILSRNLNGSRRTLDYIKLSFRKKLPMAYYVEREKHLVFLIIDPDIILLDGVILTSENSTATDCRRGSGLSGLSLIDFISIKEELAWQDPIKRRNIQAEICVPDRIGLDKIKKICCISKSSLEEAKRLCRNYDSPPFYVDRSYFYSTARGFFYTKNVILTNEIISNENVDSYRFSNKTIFSIDSDSQISLLCKIEVIPNLECTFIWKDEFDNIIRKYKVKGFESHTYFIWDILERDKMKCGDFNVSLFLNNIRQCTIHFKIKRG